MDSWVRRQLINVRNFLSLITIEPVFLLFSLNFGFYIVVAKDLYLQKVCKVNLNFSEEICDNIQQHKDEQVEVQQYVSSLQAYNSIVQAIPACIFALFAGPWSDRHGRRLLIISSVFGYILANAVFIVNTYYFYELKAEYLLFECLQDMTGGSTVFFMASYSYIADISTPESRTRRLAFLDGVFPIGFYVGNTLSGVVRKKLGFMYNFSFAMVFAGLAVLYCIFFVKDSRIIRDQRIITDLEEKLNDKDLEDNEAKAKLETELDKLKKIQEGGTTNSSQSSFKDFFRTAAIKESVRAVLRKREHYKRAIIIMLIVTFELEIFAMNGKWSALYLYLRRKLDFDIVKFTFYTSFLGMMGLIAQYVAVPILTKRLHFQDYTVAIIDQFTAIANYAILACVTYDWMLYLGAAISFLDFASTTMFRSTITKNVHPTEVGKVFSIVGTIQALIPLGAGPVFGFLYKATVKDTPAAVFYVVIGVKCAMLFILGWVAVLSKKTERKMAKELKPKTAQGVDNLTFTAA